MGLNRTIILLAAACMALSTAPRAATHLLSESEEIKTGQEASGEFEIGQPLSHDSALVDRVERIGRRLAAVSDRPELPYQFKVIDSNQVNALAFPGGYVYVYRGLIELMPSDDALAAILGHEITHAAARHWARGTELSWLTSLIGTVARTPLASTGAMVGQVALGFSYGRQLESEADRTGLKYLTRAGYDPNGAVQAWETMIKYSPSDKKEPWLLRTHPLDADRLAVLKRMAVEIGTQRPELATHRSAPVSPLPASQAVPGAFPLVPGARWVYRMRRADGTVQHTEWSVSGAMPDRAGEARLRIALPGGVEIHPAARWSGAGLELSETEGRWRLEIPTADPSTAAEPVTVPAGSFSAYRVEKPGANGARVTLWMVPGIGVVKREYAPTGLIEELESYEGVTAAPASPTTLMGTERHGRDEVRPNEETPGRTP